MAFVTLGCPKNEVDSDRMAAAVSRGFDVVQDLDEADAVVVNTCAFIEEATQESVAVVLDLAAVWKRQRSGRHVIVAGCMPSRYADELTQAMPEVDAFLPVADEDGLVRVLAALKGVSAPEGPPGPARTAPGPSAYLKVADGCHRACTYCAIPSIRGPYRSRPADELVAEASELVKGGAREIVLVAQDVSAWGRDLEGEQSLAGLLRELAAVEDLAWLRLLYVQPDGVTPELLEVIAESPVVCDYLDLPLQHASRPVLAAMGRTGRDTDYLRLIGAVRAAVPDVALRSTFICGFPGEALLRFVRAARLDYAGVFSYSAEEGTAAAKMRPRVPARTVRARTQRLRDLSDEMGFERAAARVGTRLEVLVEGMEEDGTVVGRHRGQAPEVDGGVLLSADADLRRGSIVVAEITDTLGYDLIGKVRSGDA